MEADTLCGNLSGSRFCSSCGTVLSRACAVCGGVTRPGDRFCGSCGSAVETSSDLVTRTDPAAEEILRMDTILEDLRARVVERELELETLSAQLRGFTVLYMRVVGRLLAEFDDVLAELAEFHAAAMPDDEERRTKAEAARHRAGETAQEAGFAQDGVGTGFADADEALRKLYRQVARAVHPDFATSEADRVRRTAVMKRVNEAYRDGNAIALAELLSAVQEPAAALPVGERLEQLGAQIARCEARLATITEEITFLDRSPTSQLRARVEAAAAEGRDLLAEMADVAKLDLDTARSALNARRTI